jgi:uracil-DNA glycosylase family 4
MIEIGHRSERRQVRLERLQREIRACKTCVQHGYISQAMPVFRGHAGQRIMVIGQAPAYRKAERPPYSGASGRRLNGWLERAGFPPGALHERCYLTSLTKCFPGPGKYGKGDRAPSAPEIELCRPHLEGEIELVDPVVILALGRLASSRFLGTRALSDIVGKSFIIDGRFIIPFPHPSGVSRWMNNPANQALVERAIDELCRLRRDLNL